eukprot:4956247-Prorocentrum_lima.AAC.1
MTSSLVGSEMCIRDSNVSSGTVGSSGVPVCASGPKVPLSSACTIDSWVVPSMLNCGQYCLVHCGCGGPDVVNLVFVVLSWNAE